MCPVLRISVTVWLSEVCFQKVPEFAHVSHVSRHVTSKVETVTDFFAVS